jgi:hypothetical protein
MVQMVQRSTATGEHRLQRMMDLQLDTLAGEKDFAIRQHSQDIRHRLSHCSKAKVHRLVVVKPVFVHHHVPGTHRIHPPLCRRTFRHPPFQNHFEVFFQAHGAVISTNPFAYWNEQGRIGACTKDGLNLSRPRSMPA